LRQIVLRESNNLKGNKKGKEVLPVNAGGAEALSVATCGMYALPENFVGS
jgi:hypothetical protein